ncbi:MBL fold metallo-hydrolase [Kordiimonas aquimaris]|uniref:MBL fold metallo-hydrolase n=1 Tax=Kordiimonas aquimaris TaxID=707591 RepID=UPI0021D1A50F|nr:MBL fold metallo-hydrolase [Kordiimonas aquimaris]
MLIQQVRDPETDSYTYIVADLEAQEALIIDPVITQYDQYVSFLDSHDLALLYSIETHVHADHVTAASALKKRFGAQLAIGQHAPVTCADIMLKDGDSLHFGAQRLKTIETPGHTAESCCYMIENKDKTMVFTGDTLLIGGTGRTDFQNGDPEAQYYSLTKKLLVLPDDTIVYPGHDYKGRTSSTIGAEKIHNPRLQVSNVQDYVALMNGLNLPNPKNLDVAVPSNLRCGQ